MIDENRFWWLNSLSSKIKRNVQREKLVGSQNGTISKLGHLKN